MCGISGIYSFHQITNNEITDLERSVEKLGKRGPDFNNIWKDEKVGLGHTRLSIIDTSKNGNQPLEDASGSYIIIYNGEVYNYQKLKAELKSKGYHFNSETDTEVVLNAYIEWGFKCLSKFDGFFAFAIYKKSDHSLFIARDRYGIKPLLYSIDDNHFYFASELKALIELSKNHKIDQISLNLYFQLTYIPAPYSIYEGVRKLDPGHYLHLFKGKLKKEKYYQIDVKNENAEDFSKAKSRLKSLIEESVRARMVADVPLGTFLSGGIDSSIISIIAAKEVDELNTFSIGFSENKFFDETVYAELLAKKYGTRHHTFSLTNENLYSHLHDFVEYLDEPFADSSALPVYILSKLTRDHVTVALSGDGADELFAGYNKHAAWNFSSNNIWKNEAMKFMGGFASILPQSRNTKTGNLSRQILKYKELLDLGYRDRYWYLARFIDRSDVEKLIVSHRFDDLNDYQNLYLSRIIDSDLNKVLLQDMEMVLQGDMLHKVDQMSMSHGLEIRVPFLAHEVVNYSFQIPASFKIKGNKRKYILREAFKEELPGEIYRRGKKGFEVPLLNWFKGELKSELDQVVFSRELIEDTSLFNWSEITAIKNRLHSRSPGDTPIQVWQLYVFMKWWKNFHTS